MKLVELEILCVNNEEESNENFSYLNVLSELNINKEDVNDREFKLFALNLNVLKEECFHFCKRKDYPEHCLLEFFDGRAYVINMEYSKLYTLLNDTV
jgi:hypothetical protein